MTKNRESPGETGSVGNSVGLIDLIGFIEMYPIWGHAYT